MVDLGDVMRETVCHGSRGVTAPPVQALRRRAQRRRARSAVLLTALPLVAVVAGYAVISDHSPAGQPTANRTAGWKPVVPGASSPSPSAESTNLSPYPELCDLRVPDGRLQRPVSFMRQFSLDPPDAAATTNLSSAAVAARYRSSGWQLPGGRLVVVFGLVTALTPADVGPGGSPRAHPRGKPVWVVAQCGVSSELVAGRGGPYRPDNLGTPPSPWPDDFSGVQYATFTPSGASEGILRTGLNNSLRRATRLVTVPWRRNGEDSADGRRIGISYPAVEPCGTFDHLEVTSDSELVRVQVWIRLPPEAPATCPGTGRHQAVVGLTQPLGTRQLVDPARRQQFEAEPGSPPPPPTFGPQARTLPEKTVVVEPTAPSDVPAIGQEKAEQLASATNFGKGQPRVTLGRVTVLDYFGTTTGGPVHRFIDKRLVWLFEYPWEPGGIDQALQPEFLDPAYVPPTKFAPVRSLVLLDAGTGKVLMFRHGSAAE